MSRVNKNLISYLKNPDLYESFTLGRSGKLAFHWANSQKYLDSLKQNKSIMKLLRKKISVIKKTLENEPAWLISKQNQIESNIYEIYKYFLDPRLRELWFEVNDDITLSLRTVQGPYTRLQSMRWFDYEIYRAFVFEKLLRCQRMNLRSFRLSTDIDISVIPYGMPFSDLNAKVSQIMEDGFIIKVSSKSDIQKICSSKNLQYRLDLGPLKKEISYDSYVRGSRDFFLLDDIYELGKNKENCSYSNGKEYHLFVAFSDICPTVSEEIRAPFIELLDKYRAYIESHIDKLEDREEKLSA